MKESMIRLNKAGDVQEFVSAAEKCDFDINVINKHIFIDAKSFLGVLGMMMEDMKVSYFGENTGFEQVVQKYSIC